MNGRHPVTEANRPELARARAAASLRPNRPRVTIAGLAHNRFAPALVALLPLTLACFTPSSSTTPPFDASTSPEPVAEASAPTNEAGPRGDAQAPADAGLDANVVAPSPGPDASDDASDASPGPTCGSWTVAIDLDASDDDGATSINAGDAAPLPGPPPSECSVTGDTHAPFQIINNSPCPIDVWWVDYSCEEEYFGTVAPNGGTWSNDTWETSPWRIRLAGSETLLEEIRPSPKAATRHCERLSIPEATPRPT